MTVFSSAARCRITASSSSIRRAISGSVRIWADVFSSRLCSADARSKSRASLAASRSRSSSSVRVSPAEAERSNDAAYFHVVVLFGATGEAGSEAHFHFRINAARVGGIAANLDLAAANFEEIEKVLCERFGKGSRGKRAKIERAVCSNAPRDVATRIFIPQVHLEHSRRTKLHHGSVSLWEIFVGLRIHRDGLLELRARNAIADARGHFAKV